MNGAFAPKTGLTDTSGAFGALDLAALGQIESLLGTAMGFDLRHSRTPSVC